MLLSKYAVCDSKISKFIKQQEASGSLSSLGKKAPLSKIFSNSFVLIVLNKLIQRMNEIVNKLLLVGDKFMPEMHLRQPGFYI